MRNSRVYQMSGAEGPGNCFDSEDVARRCVLECSRDWYEDRLEFRFHTVLMGMGFIAGLFMLFMTLVSSMPGIDKKIAKRYGNVVSVTSTR